MGHAGRRNGLGNGHLRRVLHSQRPAEAEKEETVKTTEEHN